jgi:hypothetical protein
MSDGLEVRTMRMKIEQVLALIMLALGVAWWVFVAVVTLLTGHTVAFYGVAIVAVFSIAALVVGWRLERSAATLLLMGAAVLVGLGIGLGWDLGTWVIMGVAVFLEMLIDAGLLIAAREEETAIELESHDAPAGGVSAQA